MGDPISVGNVDGGDPIPSGSQILDPISAGNLDGGGGGGSHICRKPRWRGGSHICRKPRLGWIPYL